MLCGIRSPSPHQHRKFLRSFRSHKNLKACDSPTQNMHLRDRRPSGASSSSLETTSSRPSTSSRRTDMSVDWDPLRLHPAHAPSSSPPLRDDWDHSRRYEPHELRQTRSTHSLGQSAPSSPYHPHHHHNRYQPSPSSTTVIYDGFDFGFPTASSKPTPAATPTPRRRRNPSPTPSDASASSDGSFSSLGYEDSPLEMGLGHGLAPAPACRPRPRPQLHLAGGSSGGTGGLDDDTEMFMRRGGWKRRGVVFVNPDAELAGEEESFMI